MIKLFLDSYKSLNRGEKYFVWLAMTTVLLLSSTYLIAGMFVGQSQYYTGMRFAGGGDKMVYFSQMEESRQGAWLVHNLYTTELQTKLSFSPLWVLLGKFGAITGLSNLAVFELFRLLFGLIFLLLIYLFISRFIKQVKWRKITFLMVSLASGLGIFTISNNWDEEHLFKHIGADLGISESNTFLTLMHSPLFILSQIIILIIFWWLIERLAKAGWREVILLGLLVLFLGIIHPYDLLIIYPVGGVWFLLKCFKNKKFFVKIFCKLLIIGAIGALAAVYFYWFKLDNPAFGVWLAQNVTLSLPWNNYLVGYGLLFIFYLLIIYRAVKSKNKYIFFLAVWSIVVWVLLFIPFQFQRRMVNGLHLPTAMLASLGLAMLTATLKKIKFFKFTFLNYFFIEIMCILMLTSALFMVVFDVALIKIGYPVVISQDNYQAMVWFKENIVKDQVVLSSSNSGNLVPAYSGRFVYIGHGHQTNYWLDKKIYIHNFFFKTNNGDKQKQAWLKVNNINFLLFAPFEDGLGDFNPFTKDYLQLVWQQGLVSIFQVK